jgi:hypothetical protein
VRTSPLITLLQVKVWFQNRRMKHKRQTLSKTDDEDSSKDDFKGDDDTQSCSEFITIFRSPSMTNDCQLQIPTRKSRVKDANFHPMMCPTPRQIHVVKTITRPVQPTIINQIPTRGRTVRCRGRHQTPQSNRAFCRMLVS